MQPNRIPGNGWLVLLGGGEFSFGETREIDSKWVEKSPDGPVGFVPAASGSTDYPKYFANYLDTEFGRESQVIPIYRQRDARRAKNIARIEDSAAVYLGGGVSDYLVEALRESPADGALRRKLDSGGVVVAIAAAAQALGQVTRSLLRRETVPGLQWLPDGVVEPNFDPGYDRRLRELVGTPGIKWGVGLPAGSALLLGPDDAVEHIGLTFLLNDADGDLQPWNGP